jgi:hypothetical protein
MDASTAAALESLVRDAFELAEVRSPVSKSENVESHRQHIGGFAGLWSGMDFERPSQGELEPAPEW